MSPSATAAEIEIAAREALISAGASPESAAPVASAMARAESNGNVVCGLFYLPIFCAQLRSGKVDGTSVPAVQRRGGVVQVDARSGFAHPAIAAGLPFLIEAAREHGVAAMSVRNSTNCLALADHVMPLSDAGLIGLCMSNAPASVAPPGGTVPLFGTNPIAFAVPCGDQPPIVVDQSMSAVTKTRVIMHRDRGEALQPGWAQDSDGKATRDPHAALAGSLLPAGGQKGANISLLVEILAAALGGSALSSEASPYGNDEGGPSNTGQFLLAIDPAHFGAQSLAPSLERLAERFAAASVRLPGRPPGTGP